MVTALKFVSGGFSGWNYNRRFYGVIGFLEAKLRKLDVWQREELNKYLSKFTCEKCSGRD